MIFFPESMTSALWIAFLLIGLIASMTLIKTLKDRK